MRDDRRYSVEGWRSRRRSNYTSAMTGSICAFSHWLSLEVGRELTLKDETDFANLVVWFDLSEEHRRSRQ